MNEVYEYRRAPGRGVIWLSLIALILLISLSAFTGETHLIWMSGAIGTIAIFAMLTPRPISGIVVDDHHLILSAWSHPKILPLQDIAHLQVTNESAETTVAVVFKDGSVVPIFANDLPETEVLAVVMAARGIPVRGEY